MTSKIETKVSQILLDYGVSFKNKEATDRIMAAIKSKPRPATAAKETS